MEHYYAYVYVRIMQALGAYGFAGFYERKAHFLQSVPYALKNLRWLAHQRELPIALPALLECVSGMLGRRKLLGLASSTRTLTVRIFSFSFHREAPAMNREMAAGLFSTASLPNPGREEQFRHADGQGCAGDRVPEPAGERAPVSGQACFRWWMPVWRATRSADSRA
jgi:hypothetical protein